MSFKRVCYAHTLIFGFNAYLTLTHLKIGLKSVPVNRICVHFDRINALVNRISVIFHRISVLVNRLFFLVNRIIVPVNRISALVNRTIITENRTKLF